MDAAAKQIVTEDYDAKKERLAKEEREEKYKLIKEQQVVREARPGRGKSSDFRIHAGGR